MKPVSRQEMRKLKEITDDEVRLQRVREIIRKIYNAALDTARLTTNRSYEFSIPLKRPHDSQRIINEEPNEFYIANMELILKNLSSLFPECKVSHAILSRGYDGKLYDISRMDEIIFHKISGVIPNSFIVIDWS
jgi:hypothetical protein